MLSVAPVSAGAASSGYYSADSYYAKDSDDAKEASQWYGKGAEAAGLSGHVEPERFNEIMQGFTPDDRRLGAQRGGKHVHQAATDLTFSASKSVSVMALVAGDKRIVAAHDKAVKVALGHVESNFLKTRVRNPESGKMEWVGGQKMMAGVFRHDTSRSLDPQLHSHAVVANMTVGEDGKWRTVQNKAIFQNKMEIGAVYRNALAGELTKIGYEVNREGRHGFVEIKGVPKDVSKLFSTRSEQIKEALAESTDPRLSAAAARAALLTREAKTKTVDRADLYKLWREEAAAKGFGKSEMDRLKQTAKPRDIPETARSTEARAAVEFAIRHISERASVYERGLVVKTALDRMQTGSILDVTAEIDRRLESGNLVSAVHKTMNDPMSDAKTILTERAVIDAYRASQGQGTEIVSLRKITQSLSNATLTDGQRSAVETSLTGADRVVGVQGYAGTGKTYMLSRVQALAEKQGYELVGLAPSHRAVQELGSASIEAKTLQSFLARNEGVAAGRVSDGALSAMKRDYANKIIVVDEASMIGTSQMRDLLTIANRVEAAKLVLVGDVKQLDAVEAGSPFRSLQKAGMATASMADIMRQKDPEMLAAVHHIIRSEVTAFFEKVGDKVEEVESAPLAAAGKWLALAPDERADTMLITQKNEWRQDINDYVRMGLRREGSITGSDVRFDRLEPQRLTTAQLGVAENYQRNDVVIFERDVKSLDVSKGDSFIVVDSQSTLALTHDGAPVREEKITLQNERTGDAITFEPGKSTWLAKSVSLYERTSIELAPGDVIRFDRTDLDEGVVNKAIGSINAIEADTVTLTLGDETKTLPRDHELLRHVDYAWGSTVHGAQGATVENAIVAMEARSLLTTQKSLYVAASRMKNDVTVFTNDKAELEATVARVTGEQPDARDLIRDDVTVDGAERPGERSGPDIDIGQVADRDPDMEHSVASAGDTRDPALTPEQEAAWRSALNDNAPDQSTDERTPDMPDHTAEEHGADHRSAHDASHHKDANQPDDGDRDDVRLTERDAREPDRPEEPEPIRDELQDDRLTREELRHGIAEKGTGQDAEIDRVDDQDNTRSRGDDGEMER